MTCNGHTNGPLYLFFPPHCVFSSLFVLKVRMSPLFIKGCLTWTFKYNECDMLAISGSLSSLYIKWSDVTIRSPFCGYKQWRSKAVVGPGSTVTWGPSVASAPRAEAGSPKCWERVWGTRPGERCKLLQWGPPAAKCFVAFCVLRWSLLLPKTKRVLCKFHSFCNSLWLHSGSPGARDPPVQ